MKGLELAERYYREIGRPRIERDLPGVLPMLAAGLAGEGSECLGYDDEISRDHDFGPGFCIWLCSEDYKKIGAEMQKAYNALPKEFMGFAARRTSDRGDGRVGVMEINRFYRQFIGDEQPPKDLMRWLYLPEHKITAAISGQVFEDNLGEFSAVRNELLNYYPEDIRIKKIAARAAAMAQSGQYNYARCMRRGDTVAANIAVTEFIKNSLSMIYLLNKKYSPYYKWQFHGLKKMIGSRNFVLGDALMLIEQLSCAYNQSHAWEPPFEPGWNPYLNTDDKKVVLIEKICSLVIIELKKQGLTEGCDDFLESHTYNIMNRIQNEQLSRCHVTEG